MMAQTIKISSKQKKYIFLILLSAFIIKIVFALTIETDIRSDSLVYHTIAKNLISTGEYSFEGKPTATLSCGYPLFVAGVYSLFGDSQFYVKLTQSLLEIFTGLFFYLVCLNFLSVRNALISLAVFTFFPSNLLFSQTLLTEPLFGLLSLSLLYYCLRENIGKEIILIGILWGYAILVRSSFSLSIFLLPLFMLVYQRKIFEGFKKKRTVRIIQYFLLFILGAGFVISPWLIRNKQVMNTYTIATQGGFTFWSGSNPDATGTWYHKIEDTNPLFNIEDEAVRDREFYKLGIDYAIHNPHKFLITGVKKLGYLFSSERMILLYFTKGDGKEKTSSQVYRSINPVFTAVVNIPYFAVMLMGIWGLFSFNKKMFFIYGFIAVWLFTLFMFVALARYHYVLIPFFVIGTVKFVSEYKTIFRNMPLSKKIIAALFNLFLLAVWASEFYLLYKS